MSIMDPSEKKIIWITGAVLALFIFSILYARGKNNELPECLPFNKAYLEPKVTQLDEKHSRFMPLPKCGNSSRIRSIFRLAAKLIFL